MLHQERLEAFDQLQAGHVGQRHPGHGGGVATGPHLLLTLTGDETSKSRMTKW